ncbi:MAG: XRE family transcriptional regulator [Eubacterium sp.]
MSVGSRIKERRLNIKLTQEKLAKLIGVTKGSIANYENEVSVPKVEILFSLFDALKCDANYLYQDNMDTKPMEFTTTLAEQCFLTKYRELDLKSQGAVDTLLKYEYEQKQTRPPLTIHESPEQYGDNITFIPELMQKICAGTGSIGDDVQFEEKAYPSIKVPSGAEYAACVSGESMEPKYSDGDIVFYKHVDTLVDGEIGIFNINNENYLKRYTKDGLEALNPEYGTIVPSDDDHIQVIGKVLGKL